MQRIDANTTQHNGYLELGGNINYFDGEEWIATSDEFYVTDDADDLALGIRYKVSNTASKVGLPETLLDTDWVMGLKQDGQQFKASPVGIIAIDPADHSWELLEAIRDATGIANENTITYPDGCGSGNDLIYRKTTSGIEQDLFISDPSTLSLPASGYIGILNKVYYDGWPTPYDCYINGVYLTTSGLLEGVEGNFQFKMVWENAEFESGAGRAYTDTESTEVYRRIWYEDGNIYFFEGVDVTWLSGKTNVTIDYTTYSGSLPNDTYSGNLYFSADTTFAGPGTLTFAPGSRIKIADSVIITGATDYTWDILGTANSLIVISSIHDISSEIGGVWGIGSDEDNWNDSPPSIDNGWSDTWTRLQLGSNASDPYINLSYCKIKYASDVAIKMNKLGGSHWVRISCDNTTIYHCNEFLEMDSTNNFTLTFDYLTLDGCYRAIYLTPVTAMTVVFNNCNLINNRYCLDLGTRTGSYYKSVYMSNCTGSNNEKVIYRPSDTWNKFYLEGLNFSGKGKTTVAHFIDTINYSDDMPMYVYTYGERRECIFKDFYYVFKLAQTTGSPITGSATDSPTYRFERVTCCISGGKTTVAFNSLFKDCAYCLVPGGYLNDSGTHVTAGWITNGYVTPKAINCTFENCDYIIYSNVSSSKTSWGPFALIHNCAMINCGTIMIGHIWTWYGYNNFIDADILFTSTDAARRSSVISLYNSRNNTPSTVSASGNNVIFDSSPPDFKMATSPHLWLKNIGPYFLKLDSPLIDAGLNIVPYNATGGTYDIGAIYTIAPYGTNPGALEYDSGTIDVGLHVDYQKFADMYGYDGSIPYIIHGRKIVGGSYV